MVVGLIPVRAGAERGLFAEEGIELEFTSIPRGDTRTAALASDNAQIMLGSAEDVVRAGEQDLHLPIVAALLNGTTYNVVAQPRFRTLPELRGETIGLVDLTSGSSVILFEMMRANGLELNRDYQALVVGGASERATALRAGAVSATTLPMPDSTRLFDEGYSNLGDSIDYVKEFQNSLWPCAPTGRRRITPCSCATCGHTCARWTGSTARRTSSCRSRRGCSASSRATPPSAGTPTPAAASGRATAAPPFPAWSR
jgi:hypothetical protein